MKIICFCESLDLNSGINAADKPPATSKLTRMSGTVRVKIAISAFEDTPKVEAMQISLTNPISRPNKSPREIVKLEIAIFLNIEKTY